MNITFEEYKFLYFMQKIKNCKHIFSLLKKIKYFRLHISYSITDHQRSEYFSYLQVFLESLIIILIFIQYFTTCVHKLR